MKKMKRIVAVLLAGVMALTMLTACGGGASLFTYNAAISNALVEKLGIPSTNDKVIVNAIEDTAAVIAETPNEYLTQFNAAVGEALPDDMSNVDMKTLQKVMQNISELQFVQDFSKKLAEDTTTAKLPILLLLDRTNTTENDLLEIVNNMSESGTISVPGLSLCVRVYEIEDSLTEAKGDGVWAIFMVVSMDKPEEP